MKNEIMQKLSAVIAALNAVHVSGKANLVNLSGSISVLEEISARLNDKDIVEKDDDF